MLDWIESNLSILQRDTYLKTTPMTYFRPSGLGLGLAPAITLPRTTAQPIQRRHAVHFGNIANQAPQIRLLIVDDEEAADFKTFIEAYNKTLNLKIDTATSVACALQKIRTADPPYTHLLTDWDMDRGGTNNGDMLITQIFSNRFPKDKRPDEIVMHTGFMEDHKEQFANRYSITIQEKLSGPRVSEYIDWLTETQPERKETFA